VLVPVVFWAFLLAGPLVARAARPSAAAPRS
jgi:hypothetical protein